VGALIAMLLSCSLSCVGGQLSQAVVVLLLMVLGVCPSSRSFIIVIVSANSLSTVGGRGWLLAVFIVHR
jgi:hypothetical protein